MSAQDLARLTVLLNTPGLTNLPVQNITTGEITITAVGPNAMDVIRVSLDSGQTRNILEDAPQSWWQNSTDLEEAVINDWLAVLDPDATTTVPAPIVLPEEVQFIPAPKNPGVGDLLYWDGTAWVLFTPGTSGYVITSNGPGVLPSYQPAAGGGGAGDVLTITGQTTTGLGDGDIAYTSAVNTWLLARSDGTRLQATVNGANTGTVGTMVVQGRIASAKFTTAGGSPAPGAEVYLAANADDGGTGAGKLTATQPSTGFLTVVGRCLDNSNYAGLQTSVIVLDPQTPIEL